MPILQLISSATCSKGQQLMTQTDAHRRYTALQGALNSTNGLPSHMRVARTVRDQNAIKREAISRRKEVPVPRHRHHPDVACHQAARNIAFRAAIKQSDRRIAMPLVDHLIGG